MSESNGTNVGRVEQVTGVVVDAHFPEQLPEIYSALEIEMGGEGDVEKTTLICEVQQHLGDDRLRAVAMDATDGLKRGDPVVDTGNPITVPVGDETLGRIFNLLGEPIDNGAELKGSERWPIHRPAPSASDLAPTQEILETGIKVIDLLAPYAKGGKVGLFGGAGVGKTVLIQELIRYDRRGARRPLRVRRRRRALARGQRPLARDERVGRARRKRCSSSAR